jgi:hypothetical protein
MQQIINDFHDFVSYECDRNDTIPFRSIKQSGYYMCHVI